MKNIIVEHCKTDRHVFVKNPPISFEMLMYLVSLTYCKICDDYKGIKIQT